MFATPLADCVTSVTSANLQKLRWFVSCDTGDADDAGSWQVLRKERMIGLIEAARRLGGQVAELNQVLCPSTRHSPRDRSLLVRLDIPSRSLSE